MGGEISDEPGVLGVTLAVLSLVVDISLGNAIKTITNSAKLIAASDDVALTAMESRKLFKGIQNELGGLPEERFIKTIQQAKDGIQLPKNDDIIKMRKMLKSSVGDVDKLVATSRETAATAENLVTGVNYTDGIAEGASKVGDDFTGILRGEKVQLPGVKTKEITYAKRRPESIEMLRKAFESTEKKKFLQNLTEDIEKLRKAGLSDSDIARMKDGISPKGWQVHHKYPLDDGGTNAMDNLILIKNGPYHKVITNFQNTFAKQLSAGEVKVIRWPIPEGKIYPPYN